jgi:hypothetical protein
MSSTFKLSTFICTSYFAGSTNRTMDLTFLTYVTAGKDKLNYSGRTGKFRTRRPTFKDELK